MPKLRKKCKECGVFYHDYPSRRIKFCSRRCAWNNRMDDLIELGIKSGKKTRFKSMEQHPKWIGGKIFHPVHGYYMIRINKKYIAEHVLVMEKHIGRKLMRGEQVHHINEIKTDNRIENLSLLTISEHCKIHKFWEKQKRFN